MSRNGLNVRALVLDRPKVRAQLDGRNVQFHLRPRQACLAPGEVERRERSYTIVN